MCLFVREGWRKEGEGRELEGGRGRERERGGGREGEEEGERGREREGEGALTNGFNCSKFLINHTNNINININILTA